MPDVWTYDYATIRVVPRVERGEFINAGVILSCDAARHLEARIELDEPRLLALDPDADLAALREALNAITLVCAGGAAAGPLGRLSPRERFHWLVAPRSTCIQTSPVHTGRTRDLHATLERLVQELVRPLRPVPVTRPTGGGAAPSA